MTASSNPSTAQLKQPQSLHFTPGEIVHQQNGVTFRQCHDADSVGIRAAQLLLAELLKNPQASFVFPTGKTPVPMYRALVAYTQANHIDWSQSHQFHLDEYIFDLPPNQTYAYEMNQQLWGHIQAHPHYFKDYAHKPMAYETLLKESSPGGRPSVVVLGIGPNGHIAFNEPNTSMVGQSPSRSVVLEPISFERNFPNLPYTADIPHAVTLGLDVILSAQHILLMATGQSKQAVIEQAFLTGGPDSPPNPALPASYLKTHPHVTVLTDFDVMK